MKGKYRNILRIAPVYAVEETGSNAIKLKPGYEPDTLKCTPPPEPSEEIGASTPGVYNIFSLHVHVESLSYEQQAKYGMQSEVILMLYENDDSTPLVIGNLQNPVTMIRIPEEKGDLLSFTRSSFVPVL